MVASFLIPNRYFFIIFLKEGPSPQTWSRLPKAMLLAMVIFCPPALEGSLLLSVDRDQEKPEPLHFRKCYRHPRKQRGGCGLLSGRQEAEEGVTSQRSLGLWWDMSNTFKAQERGGGNLQVA